jgi:hypothetical protein
MQRDVRCIYFRFSRTTHKPKYFLSGLRAFSSRLQRPLVSIQQRRAYEKSVVSRARDSGALVAENGFFKSFTPLAVLCSTV